MRFYFLVVSLFFILAYCKDVKNNNSTKKTTSINETMDVSTKSTPKEDSKHNESLEDNKTEKENNKDKNSNIMSNKHSKDNTTKAKSKKMSKPQLIKKIIRKIDSLVKKRFKNCTTAKEREDALEAVRQEIIDSAKNKQEKLGIDDKTLMKYVNIIMKSIELTKPKRRLGSNVGKNSIPDDKVMVDETKDTKNILRNSKTERIKNKLIKEITAKVDKISRKAMEQIKKSEDFDYVLNKIKEKLLSSAKRKQKALNLNTETLNYYVNIILKSVENNLRQNLNLPSRRIYDLKPENKQLNETTIKNNNVSSMSPYKKSKDKEFFCENIEQEICEDVKFIVKATCKYDDTELNINKICDGYVDCPDASDEKNCSQQILKFMHKTNKILKALVTHISYQCLEDQEQSEVTSQTKILNDVLNTQVAIIKSHAVLGDSALRYDKDIINLKHASLTNEVASVIVMTTNAINSVLCKEKHEEKKIVVLTRKMSEAIDENLERALDKIAQKASKTCDCIKQTCEKNNCTERCKNVCKNKYLLDRWVCSDEVTSLHMDLVCDGKTDCPDESDEYGCETRNSLTKVENDRTYDDILSLISLKINSDDYSHVSNNMKILAKLIKNLREVTMRPTLHPSPIKIARNETFDLIKLIYNESLKELTSDDHISQIYDFLRNIATKLLLVLKNSHTGNEKKAPNELCWCQDTRCIMPNCSRPCQRACAMERRIMNHTCAHNQNITVSLQEVCDGRLDCPLGDDEEDCKKEICQRRHLLTLSNIIKPMGDSVKSPSLSATIENWGHEAIEKVKRVEKSLNGKPTRPIIRRLLNRILTDLVMSYAAVVMTRRTNFDIVKKEYDKVASTIRNFYKSCEH